MIDDYETRAEATLLRRLIGKLREDGILSDRSAVDILYPSLEAIEKAENSR